MENFELRTLAPEDAGAFRHDMQEAFRLGAQRCSEEEVGEVLPVEDIESSLAKPGAVAYGAYVDGRLVGGAVVVIEEDSEHGHLDFLYVKPGTQSKGLGQRMWHEVERLYPSVRVWETCTPYFDKRNIHFYINRCGFAAVEFFNAKHPDPHATAAASDAGADMDMLRFEKKMG